MTLVDTSIWIDHLRAGNERLAALLERAEVAIHAFVVGELACGMFRNRDYVLGLLAKLPRMNSCADEEVLFYIARHALAGRGIGYVDAHLLAAVTEHAAEFTRSGYAASAGSAAQIVPAEWPSVTASAQPWPATALNAATAPSSAGASATMRRVGMAAT